MNYKITKHTLSGKNVEYLATPHKDSGLFAEGLPDTLVIHYTALSSLAEAVALLRDPSVKASAHLVIGRDGEIKQLIPFNKVAWHAGQSEWQGRSGLNKYSIGIEIDNAGKLTKSGDLYKTWNGDPISPEKVFYGTHRNESSPSYWQTFTAKQIVAVFAVCQVLRDKYNITTIVGHEEISPMRKIDPGPAFPLDKLRNRLFEDRSLDEAMTHSMQSDKFPSLGKKVGIVTTASLNFRTAPDFHAEAQAQPLQQDTKLLILGEENGWYQVQVAQIGWVKKEYVKIVEG